LTDSSIGYVGRIHHTKGIDLLIRAASIEPKLSVVAIGHGEEGYVGELNNLARTLQVDFTLLPYSQTPYQDLQGRVRVVAVPSLWEEAFGRIPIEAANFGLPCVIANIGGLPEAGALVSPLSLTFVPGDYFDLRRAIDATPVGIVVRRSESNRAFPNVLFARVLAAIDD
jgi:glycosyltransferase involved in cell wall biosynthesis